MIVNANCRKIIFFFKRELLNFTISLKLKFINRVSRSINKGTLLSFFQSRINVISRCFSKKFEYFNSDDILPQINQNRLFMSSSPYRRVTVEIENGNFAMVLATDIQYIGYKGLRQVYLYSVQPYGGLFTNIADILVKVEFQWIRTKNSCCLLPICE